jgi:hypothetical protein
VPFDIDAQAAIDRMLASIRAHIEADVRARADELIAAAAAERSRAAEEAAEVAKREAAEQAQAQMAVLRESAEARVADLARTLEQTREQAEQRLEASRAAAAEAAGARQRAEEEAAALHRAVDDAAAARRQAEADAAQVRQQVAEHVAAAQRRVEEDARAAREKAAAEVAEARRAAEDAGRALDAAVRERDELRQALDSARRQVEEARHAALAEVGTRVSQAVTESLAVQQRRFDETMERLTRDRHEAELARLQGLADALRSIDEARSLGEVLDRLTQAAAAIVDRVAVLVVQGDRLQTWRVAGLAAAEARPGAEIALEAAGPLGAAVREGQLVHGALDGQVPPSFAASPTARHFAAAPLTVGGVVVAAAYGDALPDSPALDDQWPVVMGVLARHASRVLEAMTVQRAGIRPARWPAPRHSPGTGGKAL